MEAVPRSGPQCTVAAVSMLRKPWPHRAQPVAVSARARATYLSGTARANVPYAPGGRTRLGEGTFGHAGRAHRRSLRSQTNWKTSPLKHLGEKARKQSAHVVPSLLASAEPGAELVKLVFGQSHLRAPSALHSSCVGFTTIVPPGLACGLVA